MSARRTLADPNFAALRATAGARLRLALLAALAAATLLLVLAPAPSPALLPAVSVAAIAAAGLAALCAWASRAPAAGAHVTLWDLAGALAFLGCAAGMLSQPESLLQLLGDHVVR
jgi:hypothetical protein